jgi:glycosyltransferase involved in cell wall biosynthesis
MSDLLILPSTAKTIKSSLYTSAMKLFEYLGAGKAIIASDIPSIREVLIHNETSYLVKPDDPQELAKAIDIVLKDNVLRTLLEKNAKKLSIKYSWTERAKEMLEKSEISIKKT